MWGRDEGRTTCVCRVENGGLCLSLFLSVWELRGILSVPPPPPQQKRGLHTRRAERGVGGSIFLKTRDIGLPSYSNNLSTVGGIEGRAVMTGCVRWGCMYVFMYSVCVCICRLSA